MTSVSDLVREDKEFSEAKFKAKADNIFIQLYTGVMKQDLTKIKHFLSEEVFNKYNSKIQNLKSKNQIQMYDELNVSDTNIIAIDENENEYRIYVNLLTKYYDYLIDKKTKKFISGETEYRRERRINLIFSKTKNAKSLGNARKCDACGANMDINANGICSYCGTTYELKKYDWILEQIDD